MPTKLSPSRTRTRSLDAAAACLLARLAATAGLQVTVATSTCIGEPDPRLCICGPFPRPAVELLCGAPEGPSPAHWDAVRVDGDERVVWRGPASGSDPDAVVAFVRDLLTLPREALRCRHRMLG